MVSRGRIRRVFSCRKSKFIIVALPELMVSCGRIIWVFSRKASELIFSALSELMASCGWVRCVFSAAIIDSYKSESIQINREFWSWIWIPRLPLSTAATK